MRRSTLRPRARTCEAPSAAADCKQAAKKKTLDSLSRSGQFLILPLWRGGGRGRGRGRGAAAAAAVEASCSWHVPRRARGDASYARRFGEILTELGGDSAQPALRVGVARARLSGRPSVRPSVSLGSPAPSGRGRRPSVMTDHRRERALWTIAVGEGSGATSEVGRQRESLKSPAKTEVKIHRSRIETQCLDSRPLLEFANTRCSLVSPSVLPRVRRRGRC